MILLFTNLFLLVGIGTTIANYSTSITTTSAGSSNIVISEIYGGGGSNNAYYNRDFVVLYNLSNSPVDLSTWSIQAASATGTSWNKVNLSGTIQASSYYLVRLNNTGGSSNPGIDLPTPDVNGTGISLSANNAKVALLNTTTTAGSFSKPNSNLIDFVGFGTANDREGSSSSDNAPAPSISTSIRRKIVTVDTDNNAADFEVSNPPTPLNSSSFSSSTVSFANYFIYTTNNKAGLCTTVGLEWSTLESTYNSLSSANKNLFVSNSANTTIAFAVTRYQYLRAIEPSLNNFASL